MKHAGLEVAHPEIHSTQIVFEVQKIPRRTEAGNTKVLAMVDELLKYVQAVIISIENVNTVAQALIACWISLFGPMKMFLSDFGANLSGTIM